MPETGLSRIERAITETGLRFAFYNVPYIVLPERETLEYRQCEGFSVRTYQDRFFGGEKEVARRKPTLDELLIAVGSARKWIDQHEPAPRMGIQGLTEREIAYKLVVDGIRLSENLIIERQKELDQTRALVGKLKDPQRRS